MRVPISWLREYVAVEVPLEELAARINVSVAEVERIERRGVAETDGNLGLTRFGRVLEAGKHPNADRLQLCRVDVGEDEPRQIVCGAWNFGTGATVAVALPGAVLPGGQKLERGPGTEPGRAGDEPVDVAVDDLEGCPRYIGRIFRDVRIGPSPPWLKARLVAAGLRPISNVVDVTNYVMHALGNPGDEQQRRLTRLGFDVADDWNVTVPTWRARDVTREADLIEEVVRFRLDDVPHTLPLRRESFGRLTPSQRLRRTVEDVLVGCGLTEVYMTSLVPDDAHP